MKKYTLTYIPQLGSFLDEKAIKWTADNDDAVSFFAASDHEFFRLGMEFQEWREKIATA